MNCPRNLARAQNLLCGFASVFCGERPLCRSKSLRRNATEGVPYSLQSQFCTRLGPLLMCLAGAVLESATSAQAIVAIKKVSDGYSVEADTYRAHVTLQGSLDRLDVGTGTLVRGTSLGKMGSTGAVSAKQEGATLQFTSGTDYRVEYSFRDDSLVVNTLVSEAAGKRDAVDGKWYYLWYSVQFSPEAQIVKTVEPPGEFVLPTRTAQRCDRFSVIFSNGTQLAVAYTGDAGFPNDPGGFGIGGAPPYTWQRGYMKADKECQFNFAITPGKPGQSVLAAPPVTLACDQPGRRAWHNKPLTIQARILGEDSAKLTARLQKVRVAWHVSDFLGNPVHDETQPLQLAREKPNVAAKKKPAAAPKEKPKRPDLAATLKVPTDRLGWFRVQATLEDSDGKLIPNRVATDYSVLRPGVLPDLPDKPAELGHGANIDRSAWLGFGLERLASDSAAHIPSAAASARRTGTRFFFQLNVPQGVTTPQGFGDHVRQTVERYRNDCKYWEIINEPQATFVMLPEKYVEYLKAAHQAVKQADPNAFVLGPTVCGIDLGYVEKVYQLGGGPSIDILTVHPYTGHWRGWMEQGIEQQYRALRELMAKYGDEKKPVWFTENGFQHTFQTTYFPEVQARFIVQEFLLAASWGLPPNQVCYFFLKNHGFENWYVMNSDDSLLPAGVAMRNFGQKTHGLEFAGKLDLGRNRVGVLYRGPDRQVACLFSYDYPTQATLKTDAGQVRVADFFGNEETHRVQSGQITIPVTGYPVFVTLRPNETVSGAGDDWGENLALNGRVTASSGQATAAQATDGICTANGNHAGVPGWVSDKGAALPQWIEVALSRPSKLRRVLVYANSSFCGVAGIRDYEVQVSSEGNWRTVGSGAENVDRWVLEHTFEPVTADKIRVVVRRVNNGGLRDDPRPYADLVARIAELEAYGK